MHGLALTPPAQGITMGRSGRSSRGGGIGARGAVGVPESRNKLVMLVVMSLQLSVAIGGT